MNPRPRPPSEAADAHQQDDDGTDAALAALWPLAALRVITSRLVLRPVPARDLTALAAAAASLRQGSQQFQLPFLYEASPQMERLFLQRYWRALAHWRPTSWHLQLGIYLDGEPVGFQEMWANDFAVTRTVGTGSWLRADLQGAGYGTEARAGVLELAFEHLQAAEAHSEYLDGNAASKAVSLKLGYRDNGSAIINRNGAAVREHSMLLDHATWRRNRMPGITVHGLADCLDLFVGSPDSDDA